MTSRREIIAMGVALAGTIGGVSCLGISNLPSLNDQSKYASSINREIFNERVKFDNLTASVLRGENQFTDIFDQSDEISRNYQTLVSRHEDITSSPEYKDEKYMKRALEHGSGAGVTLAILSILYTITQIGRPERKEIGNEK